MLLEDKIKIIPRRLIRDDRGWFLKVIDGKEEKLPPPNSPGEIYITYAKPNQSKGGHYHCLSNEWFTLVLGEAELRLKDLETDETLAIRLNGEDPITVYIPVGVAHILENTSTTKDFMLIAYADMLYDPADTIPYNL